MGKVSPLLGTPGCFPPPMLCGNTNGKPAPATTGFGARDARITHFICFTMVLFPDSPAPAEKRERGTNSEVLPEARDPHPTGTPSPGREGSGHLSHQRIASSIN